MQRVSDHGSCSSESLYGGLPVAKLTVVDKYTWKVTYQVPYPLLPIYIAKTGGGSSGMHQNMVFPAYMAPAHRCARHPTH